MGSSFNLSPEERQNLIDSAVSPGYKIAGQLNSLHAISDSEKKQAEAAQKQVEIMQKRLDLAIKESETAQKGSKIALVISIASLAVSVLNAVLQNSTALKQILNWLLQ